MSDHLTRMPLDFHREMEHVEDIQSDMGNRLNVVRLQLAQQLLAEWQEGRMCQHVRSNVCIWGLNDR